LCNIATNLDLNYDDEKIKDIYRTRWDVEVFFKLIKNVFKMVRALTPKLASLRAETI